MNIAIFESVVIESALIELEVEGKKYEGLYVDMENAPERKYVKDKAALISGLKKKVDRVRIDAAKAYKMELEKQAASIHERLDIANAPFIDLMNVYTAERKKILDAKKASDEAKTAALQLPIDHEDAIRENKLFDFELSEKERERIAHENQLKAEAVAEAKQDLINAENKAQADAEQAIENAERAEAKRVADVEQARIDEQARQAAIVKAEQDAENARLANKEHVRRVNNDALHAFMAECDFTYDQAKVAVTALAQNKILNTTINY
jgi:hypothetical protein